MLKTIISDTSCLIVLSNIGELDLLHKIYGTITTTPEIALEYGQTLPPWIEIKAAADKNLQNVLELQLDIRRSKCNCIGYRNKRLHYYFG